MSIGYSIPSCTWEFSRDGLAIRAEVSLPGVGETTLRKNVSYDELEKFEMEFVIKKITPVIEGNVLKKLIFQVEYPIIPVAANPSGDRSIDRPRKKRIPTLSCDRKEDVNEIIKRLKFVGSMITARCKVKTHVYVDEVTFYVYSTRAATHFFLKVSRETYSRILEWAKKQKFPVSYVDFESKAVTEKVCMKSHVWTFLVIAVVHKELLMYWDSSRRRTIIKLGG